MVPSSEEPKLIVPERVHLNASTPAGATLCAHTSFTVEAAAHAVRNELAVTLGDILLRRIPVALDATWSNECSRTASQRIGRALGWSAKEIESGREDFERERGAFLVKPSAVRQA